MVSKTYCERCGGDHPYQLHEVKRWVHLGEDCFHLRQVTCRCRSCHYPVLVPEIEDKNLARLEQAYREKHDLIHPDDLKRLIESLAGSLEHVAVLLQVDVEELEAILEGYLPDQALSRRINQFLTDSRQLKKAVEKAYQTGSIPMIYCQLYISRLQENQASLSKRLKQVYGYLRRSIPDASAKHLQKTLYYIQSFYLALMGEPFFSEDCQAWVHGPVYPTIYHQDTKGDPIYYERLTATDEAFLDAILAVLKHYDGDELEALTHREAPWLKMRQGLGESIGSNRIIRKETIEDYFNQVLKEYEIASFDHIKIYFEKQLGRR